MLKPWITKEILQKCKMRDSLIKSISKENDPAQITSLHIDYKRLRNEITKEKRDNKKEYYAKYFENIKLLDKNKNLICDSKKIASIFNNHFSTIGSKIEQGNPFHSFFLLLYQKKWKK